MQILFVCSVVLGGGIGNLDPQGHQRACDTHDKGIVICLSLNIFLYLSMHFIQSKILLPQVQDLIVYSNRNEIEI